MEMHSFLILIIFLVVVSFATLAVLKHRKKTQRSRSMNTSSMNTNRTVKTQEPPVVNQLSENNFDDLDPVVDGSSSFSSNENGIMIKRNDALLKNVMHEKKPEFLSNEKEKSQEISAEPTKEEEMHAKQFFPNDYISITLMAEAEKPYSGYELLQGLLSAGLRFGKRNIFHRYQSGTPNTIVLFSLASVVKPGTFEMAKMGGFSTPGLVLFMRVSTQKDSMKTFELMLETARQLRDDLEGELKTSPTTSIQEETINEIRHRIAEYEQTKGTSNLFTEHE